MPREHTLAITQEGTLKSEVRSSPMMYPSNSKSALVKIISVQFTPKRLLFALR